MSPSESERLLDARNQRPDATGAGDPQRGGKLTYLNGLAIVLGMQIGSGIFASPAQISRNVPSPGAGVLVWLVAGSLVWTGIASFIELGLSMTKNGGIQEYLRSCYGEYMGFVFSWTWICIIKGSALAIITSVFADYACRGVASSDDTPWLVVKAVGLAGLWMVTAINCVGSSAGARVANLLFVLKVLLLLYVAAGGLILSVQGKADGVPRSDLGWFGNHNPKHKQDPFDELSGFVSAVFGALFSYNGWESMGFILGDMTNPTKNLPRVLYSSLAIVVTGFFLLNVALYQVVPFGQIQEHSSPFTLFIHKFLGPVGTMIFSAGVALSTLGALNANIFSNAALSVEASRRGYFPAIFAVMHNPSLATIAASDSPQSSLQPVAGVNRDSSTSDPTAQSAPTYAILAHATIGSLYFVMGSLDSLLTFSGISQYFFLFFAVFGVFIIRYRANDQGKSVAHRLAIWNPIAFCVCSAAIVIRGICTNWWQGMSLGFMLATSRVAFLYNEQTR